MKKNTITLTDSSLVRVSWKNTRRQRLIGRGRGMKGGSNTKRISRGRIKGLKERGRLRKIGLSRRRGSMKL